MLYNKYFYFFPGFCLSLVYVPRIVAVTFYFENLKAVLRNRVRCMCGSGIGTFMFAPIRQVMQPSNCRLWGKNGTIVPMTVSIIRKAPRGIR